MKQRLLTALCAVIFAGQTCFAIEQISSDNYATFGFSAGNYSQYTNYYAITNYDDLEAFSSLVNAGEYMANAVLTTDIIINENLFLDNGEFNESLDAQQLNTVTPIGRNTQLHGDLSLSFNGVFDGAGHTIQGLYANAPNKTANMFGLLGADAIVKNIIFTDVYLYCSYSGIIYDSYGKIESVVLQNGVVKGTDCGAICVYNYGSIYRAVNNATVIANNMAGGICCSGEGTIKQCANYASIHTTSRSGSQTGGIAGHIWDGTVQDCFNTGFIEGNVIVGGILGLQSGESTVSSCYSIGNVKGYSEVGGIIGVVYHGDNPVTSKCYYVNSCLCKGITGEDVENSAMPLALSDFYSATLPDGFSSSVWEPGSAVENAEYEQLGTMLKRKVVGKCLHLKNVPVINENVYETYYNFGIDGSEDWQLFIPIYSVQDLKAIERDIRANYVLMNNISVLENLNSDGTIVDSPTETWTSIGGGNFMGKFSGDNHVISGLYGKGLFDKLGSGTIMNVRTENCYFYTTASALGSIVNRASGGMILNCRNTSKVEGASTVGGICGEVYQSSYYIDFRLENCWNSGDVTGSVIVGGVVGESTGGTIRSCCNTGNVNATSVNCGGVGSTMSSNTVVEAVCNFGTVKALHDYVGGLLLSGKKLSQSYNAGVLVAEGNAGSIMKSGSESDAVNCYYDSDKNTWKGIGDADFAGSSMPLTTIELCSGVLPVGFSSNYWTVREPQIVDGYKLYFYPYLKNIGEESAQVGFKRKVYSLKLHANGGSYGDDITFYVENEGVSLPSEVVRTGYEFKGWYSNSNYTSEVITSISGGEKGDKEMYAKWIPCVYTISLQTDGGTVNSGKITSYTYGYGVMLPTDVTRTGYTFGGWCVDKDCSGEPVVSISLIDTGNKTFYAKWDTINYTITYNANDGDFAETPVNSYRYGDEVTLPTPTREGYTFAGWYNNSNLVGTKFTEILASETGNKEFWAKWEVNSYAVTLDVDGGDINSGNVASYTYNVLTILPQDVTKVGHTFEGWFDSENQKVTQISKGTIGDVTFTAHWTAKTYSVTLQTNNGTINAGNVTSYTFGTAVTLPTKEQITKTGYEFLGWYDNSSYDGGAMTEIADNEIGNKNFWARWTASSYKVTLDAKGGTINSGAFAEYTYGVVASLPTNVSKEGYTFTGWYADEACEGDVVSIISSTSTGDKTFYAGWSNTAYAVTLYTNDGVISAGNVMAYTFGNAVTLPTKEQISKTGYTFKGWYDNSSCTGTAQTGISADATGNKSFWAKWTVNTYNVTFVNNGGTINSGNVTGYTFGVGANLPSDVTKTGHKFAGWYDNADFAGDRQTRIDEYATEDQTFYANWTANEYTITYEVVGGSIEDANYKTAYVYGGETALPATVSKAGHKFAGWFTNSAYEGSAVTGISATEYGNKTFYAKWTVNSYTVTLNANGGTINNGNVTNYTYGVGATLPADVTKTGYAFNGWYDNDEFAGEAITTVANNETGDKTFFAKFTVNTYNVILVTNEGTINAGNVESYEFGKGATLPTDVTKTGYTFDGWYSNSSYVGGSVSSIAGNDMGDKQFWAKWTIKEYEVTATAENGTVEGTGSYEYKSPATLKAVPNDGYEFVGWNDNTLTDARIQLVVTKDTTLTANFKEKEKVQIAGTLEIPTLKTERESAPIDLIDLFVTTEGSDVIYSATSSAPNVVAATVSEGKLFLTVYEYEGEAEITVTATLPNGEKNSVKATANVVLACNIQVEETITNVSCFGESDGEIALKVTNAAEPYTTKWENETSVEDTIRNIVAGNYSVVITDNENCVYNKTYTVTQPAEMTMKATVKNPTCENADGSISIVLTGTENATFAWSNEATSQNIASLAKGDYSVVITNTVTGCSISDSYTLVEPEAPVVTVSNVLPTSCNEPAGAITISVSEDGLLYNWSNNKHTKNLTNVPAGDYTLNVI
ncbi:MAG: InlB B-repeat-containing protein, partial [Bacteroidales bacterium]|nr:InlB B-repeat-containing protein [Bacteroidales bacterium]